MLTTGELENNNYWGMKNFEDLLLKFIRNDLAKGYIEPMDEFQREYNKQQEPDKLLALKRLQKDLVSRGIL
jgi:hypothetical protein